MKCNTPSPLSPLANPLVVQFWLGARAGTLRERGFERGPERRGERLYGSSLYRLHPLELHSSGLTLHLPTGTLGSDRPRQSFRLCGEPVSRPGGLRLLQPHVHEHEAWIAWCWPDLRTRQLAAPLPHPVRQQMEGWHAWVTRSLELRVWQPYSRAGSRQTLPDSQVSMVRSELGPPRTPGSARRA